MERFHASGKGWQTRIDSALKDWLKDHSPSLRPLSGGGNLAAALIGVFQFQIRALRLILLQPLLHTDQRIIVGGGGCLISR